MHTHYEHRLIQCPYLLHSFFLYHPWCTVWPTHRVSLCWCTKLSSRCCTNSSFYQGTWIQKMQAFQILFQYCWFHTLGILHLFRPYRSEPQKTHLLVIVVSKPSNPLPFFLSHALNFTLYSKEQGKEELYLLFNFVLQVLN